MNTFTFGGTSSTVLGLIVEERYQPTTVIRSYERVKVEGRDDELYIDKGSYNNITLAYRVASTDVDTTVKLLNRYWTDGGYQRLTDTYNPNGYRRAFIVNPVQFAEDLLNFGHAVIEFSADPFFYFDLGDEEITVSSNTVTLENPDFFYKAKPTIYAEGTAGSTITLYIYNRSYAFKIPTGSNNITIDCLNETAYTNHNGLINATNSLLFEEFPYIDDKSQITVRRTGGTLLKITPRWRRL